MNVYHFDPLQDPRWLTLLARHPNASVFHTPGWLKALHSTYGYKPFILTTSKAGEELTNGLAVCCVKSHLTGRRLVSLPFSDHCEPLLGSREDLPILLAGLRDHLKSLPCKYAEIRPIDSEPAAFPQMITSATFWLHRLDLRSGLDDLFRGFHKGCVRRKIGRAEREGLSYEGGRSETLLTKFYRLFNAARRRQLLLPPPLSWFHNLVANMGDMLKIHVASKDGQPIASILTLSHKTTLFYKYGASDRHFNSLGGTQLLLWKAIQEAKQSGSREFDMGRSDWDAEGLVTFKNRWGAVPSALTYWRYGVVGSEFANSGWRAQIARKMFGRMPDRLLSMAGSLLYRHFG